MAIQNQLMEQTLNTQYSNESLGPYFNQLLEQGTVYIEEPNEKLTGRFTTFLRLPSAQDKKNLTRPPSAQDKNHTT